MQWIKYSDRTPEIGMDVLLYFSRYGDIERCNIEMIFTQNGIKYFGEKYDQPYHDFDYWAEIVPPEDL